MQSQSQSQLISHHNHDHEDNRGDERSSLVRFELAVAEVRGDVAVRVELLLRPGSRATQVGLVEEPREEDKVAEVHRQTVLDVDLGDVALGLAALEVLVGPDIDRTADDHLRQLEGCDDHGDGFRWRVSHRAKGVVGVHDGVDKVVHDDEPASGGSVLGVGEPGVEEDGDVVVPVKEDERLFPENDEDGVSELGQLREDEHPRPETRDPILLDETEKRRKKRDRKLELGLCNDIPSLY